MGTNSGGEHAHPDFDELFLFLGTNPYDNLALGGELEFWLGEGEDAQKFIAKTPTAEWVPRNLAHHPLYFSKVDSRDKPIIMMAIAITSQYSLSSGSFRRAELPPAFSFEKVGQEQKNKELYTKYVNELKFAMDRLFPWQRGKIAVPTLMFNKNIYPETTLWVEIFHVYAAGSGVGIPTFEPIILPGRELTGGMRAEAIKGGGHAHDLDKLFLFFGTDPHDTLNLGGEVEFWLGEGDEAERFITTKAMGAFVPGGVVHNPIYFRRVDRPIMWVVIALTGEYAGSMRGAQLPPGFRL